MLYFFKDNTDLEYHIEPHPDEELNSDSVLNKNKGCKRKLELDDYDLVDIVSIIAVYMVLQSIRHQHCNI